MIGGVEPRLTLRMQNRHFLSSALGVALANCERHCAGKCRIVSGSGGIATKTLNAISESKHNLI